MYQGPGFVLFAILFFGFLFFWYVIRPVIKDRGGVNAMLNREPAAQSPDQILISQADQLMGEVRAAVNRSILSPERKRDLLTQAAEVPANVRKGVERLAQIQRLRELAQQRGAATTDMLVETTTLENQTRADINHSLDVLTRMPLALTRIEVERENVDLDRMMSDLSETNARLNDTAEAAKELRAKN